MRRDLQSPISTVEADAALAVLARFDHVVLAVSGGPDSMALMALAAEWRARFEGLKPNVSVATVDHGLRARSRHEAEMVAVEARRLGLPHAILSWDGEKPTSGLSAAAREARYRLLEAHAKTIAAANIAIVTAHHRDDQAETFAMRLARGAGLDGLASMRGERPLRDGAPIVLMRPLLAFPKARLLATVALRGITYAEDPTNRDRRYERARVRSTLEQMEEAGLSSEAIATSARRLGEAREALAYAEAHFVASLDLSYGNDVFAKLDRRAFEAGPAFLRQKVLAQLIARYGGASPSPQLFEVEDLVARMQRDAASAATLGGAVVSSGPRFVRVWREVGRLGQAEITLCVGEATVWDQRFVVRFAPDQADMADAVTVKPLGEKGYAAIVLRLAPTRRPPTRAAQALPSFWIGDSFLAAPSLAPFALFDAAPLDPKAYEISPWLPLPDLKELAVRSEAKGW
ncbi:MULTISPECIES: tRNA lysidine(34) synthetase TilS [unclassified Hyphomicrobium]|uniref:tRNA lysidine(34) synthetase TilS n=1 Tax=unclassified Hyphomicrobium TaxID=2619925 RepID=UPI000213F40D|nr:MULTISPECIES: tRNA lysidine(34) synthetase TilS [unclassified Hyphomicrobium]CCB64251.1 tRNA(Ile)-lysidine synthase [Hyphomicrobium sp. MC1]